jgi:hypothetical protein
LKHDYFLQAFGPPSGHGFGRPVKQAAPNPASNGRLFASFSLEKEGLT